MYILRSSDPTTTSTTKSLNLSFKGLFCLLLTFTYLIALTGPALAQSKKTENTLTGIPVKKEMVGDFSGFSVDTQVSSAASDAATYQKAEALLQSEGILPVVWRLQSKGYVIDPAQTVLVAKTQDKEFYALALRNATGEFLIQDGPSEQTLTFMIFANTEFSIIAQLHVDKDSRAPQRLDFATADGSGVQINYTDQKVYELSPLTEDTLTVNPKAVSGTVGCVINALKELAKPCNAAFLLVDFQGCVAAIAAAPASAGLTAIVGCIGVIQDIAQAVICAGVDCGIIGSSPAPSGTTLSGSVTNQKWWTGNFNVPSGKTKVKVSLSWSGSSDLDLHLTSASGAKYGYGENTTGYSGYSKNPEVIEVQSPKSGSWQVRVFGYSVLGSRNFKVKVEIQ